MLISGFSKQKESVKFPLSSTYDSAIALGIVLAFFGEQHPGAHADFQWWHPLLQLGAAIVSAKKTNLLCVKSPVQALKTDRNNLKMKQTRLISFTCLQDNWKLTFKPGVWADRLSNSGFRVNIDAQVCRSATIVAAEGKRNNCFTRTSSR